jgi:leader peptidase (prepilin peptidase) / N-methyltransferase
MISVFAVIGALGGWASWVLAGKLTAVARAEAPEPRALLLFASISGSGLLAVSAARSGGEIAMLAVVAVLSAPLLITLLTDLLAHLVFPAVLLPGLLAALVIAAMGPPGLPAAIITGAVAAGVTALLVVLSGWFWSGAEETPLGSGDVVIAATIGTMFGPDQTPVVLFAGMALGAAAAAFLILTRRAGRGDVIPYGAFLCGAALVAHAM